MTRYSLSTGFDIMLPIFLGVLFVLNIVFMLGVPLIWLGLLKVRSNARRDRNLPPLPIIGSVVSACLFGSIVYAAAAYEPTKTKQQHLSRELTFPTKDIKLAELAYLTSRANEDWQFLIRFSFPDEDKHEVVHLPSETVTVQQLVAAIQRDTDLEGRFHSCGNGYSILYGEDCGFGLTVSGKYFTEEPFDLYAYVDERFKVGKR